MLKEGGGLKAAIGPDGTLSYFEKREWWVFLPNKKKQLSFLSYGSNAAISSRRAM